MHNSVRASKHGFAKQMCVRESGKFSHIKSQGEYFRFWKRNATFELLENASFPFSVPIGVKMETNGNEIGNGLETKAR